MLVRNVSIVERSDIINLTPLNDKSIAYCTKYNGAKIIDAQNHKTLIRVINKELGSETTALSFSPDATLLAFANKNIINILSLQTAKIIKSIKTPSQKIEILTFCSHYIIAGTNAGRVFQYRYDNAAILSRVCSFPYIKNNSKENYISAFATLNNQLACSGQGGAIFLMDIYTQAEKKVLLQEGKRVNTLCFINKNTLVSGDIGGTIFVYDLEQDAQPKKIDAPFVNIKQIIKMPNPNFIAISGDENYIAIADIKKCKILHAKYVEFQSNVSQMVLSHERSILVALDNATLIDVPLSTPDDLKQHLQNNSIDKAYALVESEPMLLNSMPYKLLEKQYQNIYQKAIGALTDQNKTLALKSTLTLKNVTSKQQEIAMLFNAFEHYNRFKMLYFDKKYALAFAIADKLPALKYTPIYTKLEDAWRDSFVNAHRHILLGKDENAKALMNEYITVVSKRPIIKLFLGKDKDFMQFLQAIELKDFQTIEELTLKNELFTQAPTYFPINETVEKSLKNINTLLYKSDLNKAKEALLKIKKTAHSNHELKKVYNNFENMKNLIKAYKSNDFKSCYELLDKYPLLNKSELGILLNKHWIKLMNECEEHALQANPKEIKTTLGELLFIETRRTKIGDLLRVSFHSKIKAFLSKGNFRGSQNIIYSYIDIFGSDSEINSLMRTYEVISKSKLAITQNQHDRLQRDNWIHIDALIHP